MHYFNRIVFMESIDMFRYLSGRRLAALLLIAIITASVFAGRLPAVCAAEIAPEEEEDVYPAFDEQTEVDGVIVRVMAGEGAFPDGAVLSVQIVSDERELTGVEDAVGSERDRDRNVAVSYIFDIKVLDEEGNELKPAEGKSVTVSFGAPEIANENLAVQVYHIPDEELSEELTAQKLEVRIEQEDKNSEESGEAAAVVETDGFSYYTVEFTYGTLEYVLEGDETVPLSEVLHAVGLTGEAEDAVSSDAELFCAFREDDEWYVSALQPFDTGEWLEVTLDGIPYRITVTDDVILINNGTEVDVDGVYQGEDGSTFAKKALVATIFIVDEYVEDANGAVAWINPQAEADGFRLAEGIHRILRQAQMSYGEDVTVDEMLRFDFYDEDNDRSRLTGVETVFDYDDPIATYTFPGGAQLTDGSYADVVVTYESITFVVPAFSETVDYGDKQIGCGNGIHFTYNDSYSGAWYMYDDPEIRDLVRYTRIGALIEINVRIEKDGEKVDGSFYFPMKGLTIDRLSNNNWIAEFSEYEKYDYFSEGNLIHSGYLASADGYSFFVPGGTVDILRQGYTIPYTGYAATAKRTADGEYHFSGGGGGTVIGDDSFFNGYLTTADNTAGGIDFTFIATGVLNGGNNNVLIYGYDENGNHLWHRVKATTGPGGTVETTGQGNPNGDLSDGTVVYDSKDFPILTMTQGSSVTYKMTPAPGYKLKSITAIDGSLNVGDDGNYVPEPVLHINEDGSVYYTFGFDNIAENHALHVEWEPTKLTVKKTVEDPAEPEDSFPFTISVWRDIADTYDTYKAFGSYAYADNGGEAFQLTSTVAPLYWEKVRFLAKYGTDNGDGTVSWTQGSEGQTLKLSAGDEVKDARGDGTGLYETDYIAVIDDKVFEVFAGIPDYKNDWTSGRRVCTLYLLDNRGNAPDSFVLETERVIRSLAHREHADLSTDLDGNATGLVPADETKQAFTFSLTNNTSIELTGIVPVGWEWEISEGSVDGWYLMDRSGETGTMEDDDEAAEFINDRNAVTVTKIWEDDSDALGRRPGFDFTLTTDREGTEKIYTKADAYSSSEEGDEYTYQFYLHPEETVTGCAEETVPGYTGEEEHDEAGNYTFTNTICPYQAHYVYKGELPEEVLETLPEDPEIYLDGDKAKAKAPSVLTVKVGNITYTFAGWDKDEEIVEGADVLFTGTWTAVKDPDPTYRAHYTYKGELPEEVLETLPDDPSDYQDGDMVKAKAPSALKAVVEGGTWVFRGWDRDKKFVEGADVIFTGTWESIPDGEPVPEPEPEPDGGDDGDEPEDEPSAAPPAVHYTIRISGTKTWIDGGYKGGQRPHSVIVRLHADGKEVAHRAVSFEAGGTTNADIWTFDFGEYDMYSAGVPVVYTLTEDAPVGYTAQISQEIRKTKEPEGSTIVFSVVNTASEQKKAAQETGDESRVFLWGAIMMAALAGLGLFFAGYFLRRS